jgi:class 3 adenylate cyclase
MTLILSLVGMFIGGLHRGMGFTISAGFGVLLVMWSVGLWGFRSGLPLLPLVAPSIALALSLWLMDMLVGRAERKQRQFIQGAFSRYVSPAVVNKLAENPDALIVKGHRQPVTFVFTDVAGFTEMSETLDSAVLSEMLNEYLDGACEIIFQHAGTIDKFIGDAIMIVFNAPVPQQDHVQRAVRCALELDTYCEAFRVRQSNAGIDFGVTRIGIHTGDATVGNFGSHTRMDFTALGDTVNTAARTEGVNKYFGTRICCTQSVVDACSTELAFQPIGDVILKGKRQSTTLYNPIPEGRRSESFIRDYRNAYQRFAMNDAADIREAFFNLIQRYPNEPLAQFHAQRVRDGMLTALIVMEDK